MYLNAASPTDFNKIAIEDERCDPERILETVDAYLGEFNQTSKLPPKKHKH